MSLRINGLTAREIVVAANRARVKAPVNNLLRFAAEISGKALSQSSSFDWKAALAETKQFIEANYGEEDAAVILAPFFPQQPEPAAQPQDQDALAGLEDESSTLDMRGGLEAAARRFAEGGPQFRLPNEEAITTIVDESVETDSDGGTCD